MTSKLKQVASEASELAYKIKRMTERVAAGCIPSPTRRFEIGEQVSYGNHVTTEIIASYDDHFYAAEVTKTTRAKGGDTQSKEKAIVLWTDLFSLKKQAETHFATKSPVELTFSNRSIDSLLNLAYSFGAEMNPSYQRPLTWDASDKESLIESIFAGIDIGKLAFAKNAHEANKKGYEVIDGKQRLSTLLAFYEDRFCYRDTLYSMLSNSDKLAFIEHPVQTCILENCSLKGRLDAFIAINTRGKDISHAHVQQVIAMRADLDELDGNDLSTENFSQRR